MTYNEKKSLYESIMQDIAKTVKRQINESDDSELSTNERTFFIINGDNEKDRASFSIRYNSINKLYLICYIIRNASSINVSDSFFKIKSNSADFEKKFKEFEKTKIYNFSDDIAEKIDKLIENVYRKCFSDKTKSSDVAKSIESILPSILNIEFSSNTNNVNVNHKVNLSNSSLYNKCLNNVRDILSRRNFDKEWAIETMPLNKYTDEELLFRYSAALKLFNLEKPTNIQDVIKIGVFKNYIFEYINRKMRSTFENLPI